VVLLLSGTSVAGVTATVAPASVVVAARRKSAAGVAMPAYRTAKGTTSTPPGGPLPTAPLRTPRSRVALRLADLESPQIT